jgi:hypothetical protein
MLLGLHFTLREWPYGEDRPVALSDPVISLNRNKDRM